TMNIPNKFGEYLSAGLPVILGLDGVMTQLVKKNNCGYMYKDGKRLAEIILELKNNNNHRNIMSRNAKKLYHEKFNSEIIYADMVKYLEDIVSKTNEGSTNIKTSVKGVI